MAIQLQFISKLLFLQVISRQLNFGSMVVAVLARRHRLIYLLSQLMFRDCEALLVFDS